jgi:outer membrane protein OmpA-like peptidoglycan-associated protein
MSEQSKDLFGSITIKTAPPKKTKAARHQPVKPPPPAAKRGGFGISWKWIAATAVAVGLYAAFGFFLVPYLIKNYLPGYLEKRIGIHTTVEQARFNPFSFTLSLDNLAVNTLYSGRPAERILTLASFHTDVDFISLLRRDFVLRSLEIDSLDGALTRLPDKSYNISYLLGERRAPGRSDIIDFAELPFLFSINNIRLTNSRLLIDDQSTGTSHRIENIDLSLPVISNFPFAVDSYIHPRFSATINGAPFVLTGEAVLGTAGQTERGTQLSLDLDDFDIALYMDYLPFTMPVTVTSGKVDGLVKLFFAPYQSQGERVRVEFSLTINEIDMQAANRALALRTPQATCEGTFHPFAKTLELQSVLLREPRITGYSADIKTALTRLAPLFFKQDDEKHGAIPNMSVRLFIADGGSYQQNSGEENGRPPLLTDLQVSLRDFSNQPGQGENGSFRISGTHEASDARFTWQGNFNETNMPGGNLQVTDIPAATVAGLLGIAGLDVSGSGDLTGLFVLMGAENDRLLDYGLTNAAVTVRDLRIKHDDQVWLSTPNLRSEPVSRLNGVVDLGNVFLANSTITVNRDTLLRISQFFADPTERHIIHGLDFSGSITIAETAGGPSLVDLREVSFQANRLALQELQQDNFAFSARTKAGGTIKATGGVHIAPMQIGANVSVAEFKPAHVFSWFEADDLFVSSEATIFADGYFQYPQQDFQGEVQAREVRIGSEDSPLLIAQTVQLSGLNWSRSRRSLRANVITIEEPRFSWQLDQESGNPVADASSVLRSLLLPATLTGPGQPESTPSPFLVEIAQILCNSGFMTYRDTRLTPPVELTVAKINAQLRGLRYPSIEPPAEFNVSGELAGYPFAVEGSATFLHAPPVGDVTLSIANLPLALLDAQISSFTKDLNTSDAVAVVNHQARWRGDDSAATTRLRITGLRPAQPNTSAALALAMLTGENNELAVTITRTGEQLTRPLLDEAFSDFNTALVKASIDPLLMAGQEFTDLVENPTITFAPGSFVLDEHAVSRLGRFAEFLAAHPMIKVRIAGYADDAADGSALLAQLTSQEEERVAAENERRLRQWQQRQELERVRRELDSNSAGGAVEEQDIPPLDDFAPLLPRVVEVQPDMLESLADQREAEIYRYLNSDLNVPAGQLTITDESAAERVLEDNGRTTADITIADRFGDEQINNADGQDVPSTDKG